MTTPPSSAPAAANETATDLLAEYRDLDALCATLTPQQWALRSEFYGWTPWDEIAHLCYFDETSLQSVGEPERFVREAALLGERTARGEEISAIARSSFGHLDGPALLALWRSRYQALVQALAPLDPKARLAWYGPPMSARSFATARLMETWAHGQDIWDVMRRRRPATPRLKHIAHLGVTTFAWTFVNRGLPVPQVSPYLALQAPDGGLWTWGDPASPHRVEGSAEDFCLLVTQRRNLHDTQLRYTEGPVAQWLAIAQCFAGEPADGPAPGVRKVVY
ncbi:MAG TPA: TIGR03084 family metal-binding protein [Ramlibacter sp.]|nr:TIGR03084 family metal-binding protein [Ramlibacter sp.]